MINKPQVIIITINYHNYPTDTESSQGFNKALINIEHWKKCVLIHMKMYLFIIL